MIEPERGDCLTYPPGLKATPQSAEPMLNDLQADPNGENNIASTHPKMVAALRAKPDAH
jgi:hypothetical protein